MQYLSATNQRRGVSLAEVMISSMLVGVVLVGALNVTGSAVKTRRLNADRDDGPQLAVELLAEVMSKSYEEPDGPTGLLGLDSTEASPRENFDDIDDLRRRNRVIAEIGGDHINGHAHDVIAGYFFR